MRDEVMKRGAEWYAKHQRHVDRLLEHAEQFNAYPPSGSDAKRPELWKVGHWKWFRENRDNQ